MSEDGHAVRRDIETGISDDTGIAVTKGLNKNDEVIVSWSSQLKNGVEIKVTEKEVSNENNASAPDKGKITDPTEITAGEASTEINPDIYEGSKDTEEE